jgi:uncharacterized membrane protein
MVINYRFSLYFYIFHTKINIGTHPKNLNYVGYHMIRNTARIVLILFYLLAGLNHFRAPQSYVAIIPGYLPYPAVLNIVAGICEIAFALLYILPKTRVWAAWGIVLMLLAFLPVHIDMILHAPLMLGNFKVTPLIAWLRLPLQMLLILWAWWCAYPPDAKHS